MEQPADTTDKRRRRSPSPTSSPSPGPSRPSAQLTMYSDRHLDKRQRRNGNVSDSKADPLPGHLVRDDSRGDHARVLHGNAYDQRNINQHEGNHFEGGQAQDSARVHNGNHYGPVNNYNCPPGVGSVPDVSQKSKEQSQTDLALAMESLSFTRMENRQANIQKAYLSTCKWIFGKTEYNNWRNADLASEHNGFFWIKSKPGAGKSTLMKFLVQSAAKHLPDDHVISFFFNARGELLERSLEGLYRGLLHQLFTVIPRLQEVLNLQEIASFAHQAWPLNILKTLFSEAVAKLGQDRVTCFIDALDECPEVEIRDMIDFFEELGESTAEEDIGLRVCFSSRHYPQITMMKCQPMVLDGQDGHEDDIARYVKRKLKVRGGKQAEDVRVAVQAKAKGIFMWVVLVVRILNEESDRGSNNAKLRKCLDRIPAELHDLFQDILQRGIQDNKHLVPILQWISFAQTPLTREELYFAVHGGDPDFVASQPWDPDEIDAESMDLFILETSKGLAETTKGKTPTIQFIHESVRDYLRETGFAALAPELGGNLLGLTHEYLKRCCFSLITEPVLASLSLPSPLPKAKSEEAKNLRKKASAMFPFLDYATDNIAFHAELACVNGVDQAEFIATMSRSVWRHLASLFAIYETRRYMYPPEISIARKFAYVGAAHLLSSAFSEHPRDFGHHELRMALEAAIKSRNVKLVEFLLNIHRTGACAGCLAPREERHLLIQAVRLGDTSVLSASLEGGIPIRGDSCLTELLSESSKAGNVQAIRYLSARSIDIPSFPGGALHIAITRGLDDIAQLLIDRGSEIEIYIEEHREHPLVKACELNRAGIVRILLRSDTSTTTPKTMGTLLSKACTKGYGDVVQALLDHGAPVDFLGPQVNTPLFEACSKSHLAIVNMLLENGADVKIGKCGIAPPLNDSIYDVSHARALEAHGDRSPLPIVFNWMAFHIGRRGSENEAIARLLLDHSANPNSVYWGPAPNPRVCVTVRSLIYGAAITNNAELLRVLFEKGADANADDGEDYHDALEDSSRNGRVDVVKVLLANGASVPYRDATYYLKVVQDAVRQRRRRIVELLLTEGHAFRAKSRDWYSKALDLALSYHYDEIAKTLMDNGVELPELTITHPPSPSARFYC
jgi:ankyrin repeat protein